MTTPKVKPTITANPMTICTFLTRNSPPILAEVFYYVNYVNPIFFESSKIKILVTAHLLKDQDNSIPPRSSKKHLIKWGMQEADFIIVDKHKSMLNP